MIDIAYPAVHIFSATSTLKIVSDVTKLFTENETTFSNFEYISNISATIIKLYFLLI